MGVQPGEDGPLRAGDEGADPRVAEVVRSGSGEADQGEGGGDREGGEDFHGRGGQAPEGVPEAPGGQGSYGYGGEGVWPRAHEVREGACRQGGALSRSSERWQRDIFKFLERAYFLQLTKK